MEVFLAILSRILAQSCDPLHDYASIHDSILYIAKKTSCYYFSYGASLHHCSFSRTIFALFSRMFVKLAPFARACVNLQRCALPSRAEFSKDV